MVRDVDIEDPVQGKIKLLVTFSSDDNWGDFEPLRKTTWGQGITTVTAEAYSHALHGWATPLVRQLSRDPMVSAKRVSDEEGHCALANGCIGWNRRMCRPGGRGSAKKDGFGPPACYEAPTVIDVVAARVASAWKERRHPVVVVGEEFVLS